MGHKIPAIYLLKICLRAQVGQKWTFSKPTFRQTWCYQTQLLCKTLNGCNLAPPAWSRMCDSALDWEGLQLAIIFVQDHAGGAGQRLVTVWQEICKILAYQFTQGAKFHNLWCYGVFMMRKCHCKNNGAKRRSGCWDTKFQPLTFEKFCLHAQVGQKRTFQNLIFDIYDVVVL